MEELYNEIDSMSEALAKMEKEREEQQKFINILQASQADSQRLKIDMELQMQKNERDFAEKNQENSEFKVQQAKLTEAVSIAQSEIEVKEQLIA